MSLTGPLAAFALLVAGGMLALVARDEPDPTPERKPMAQLREPPADVLRPGGLVVPVRGVTAAQLIDTWGQSREGGARAHQAIDIPAPAGTPVMAAMAGTVEKLFYSERGGLTAYVRSRDGSWMAYYAHLAGYAPGIAEGGDVRAGQPIGFVGDTGNAGPGNTHLHFALHRMARGERWSQGAPVNPYPLLARDAQGR